MRITPCTLRGHDPTTLYTSKRFGTWCDRCISRGIGIEKNPNTGLPSLTIGDSYWFRWSPFYHFRYGMQAQCKHAAGSWVLGYEGDWREWCYFRGAATMYRIQKIIYALVYKYYVRVLRSFIFEHHSSVADRIIALRHVPALAHGMIAGEICIRGDKIDATTHEEHSQGEDSGNCVRGSCGL